MSSNPNLASLDISSFVRFDPRPSNSYPIASGVSSEVFKGTYTCTDPATRHTHDIQVAIKKVVPSAGEDQRDIEQQIHHEIQIWNTLQHPNITHLLGIAYLGGQQTPCMVSAFCLRNDLLAYIARYPGLKREKALDIARGVQYLHSQGIAHGELKVDNVLISDAGTAQLNDFGKSRRLDCATTTTRPVVRNIRFTAPELIPLDGGPSGVPPTRESDMFSLGMLFLQLFHGYDPDLQSGLPYNHARLRSGGGGGGVDTALLQRIRSGDRPLRARYNPMGDREWAVLVRCWAGDPRERPAVEWVLRHL